MIPYSPCTWHLEPTQILTLWEAAPALLTVTDGTLWLTRSDGEEDIILVAGDCAEIDAGDTSVASPLGRPSTIETAALTRHPLAHAA